MHENDSQLSMGLAGKRSSVRHSDENSINDERFLYLLLEVTLAVLPLAVANAPRQLR